MEIRHWLRPPRLLPVVFLAVALVSGATLGWLGWLLLEQDAALAVQRQQDALEQAADRAAASMQRSIGSFLSDASVASSPDSHLAIGLLSG
jgi:threonine/homoserine/homoserine lactone efflux protein